MLREVLRYRKLWRTAEITILAKWEREGELQDYILLSFLLCFNPPLKEQRYHCRLLPNRRVLPSPLLFAANSFYSSFTEAPSSVTSSILTSHSMFSFLNSCTMVSAMFCSFDVERAKIVGPAPERQIPNRPGWVEGVTEERIRAREKGGLGRWKRRKKI